MFFFWYLFFVLVLPQFERLMGADSGAATKTFGLMSDAIEDFAKDQTAFATYLRNVSRQQQQQRQCVPAPLDHPSCLAVLPCFLFLAKQSMFTVEFT